MMHSDKAAQAGKAKPPEHPIHDDAIKVRTQKRKFLVLTISAAALVAIAFGLGFGLRDNNKSSADLSEGQNNDGVSKSPTTSVPGKQEVSSKRLPLVTERSLQQAYDSCDSLAVDLKEAVKLQAQYIISQNINPYNFDENGNFIGWCDYYVGGPGGNTSVPIAFSPESGPAAGDASTNAKGVSESNFGTNVQVDGVDEPDIVKSDGLKVWAAYGADIVVLKADNVTVLDRITIPNDGDDEACAQSCVQGLLLVEDKLVVITGAWCAVTFEDAMPESGKIASTMPIFQASANTRVLVYDKNSMNLLESKTLTGDFVTARAIENTVHIVNLAYFNTWELLYRTDLCNSDVYGGNFTKDEYRSKAMEQIELHIDEFIEKLVDELDCTSIQQIVRFQNSDESVEIASVMDSMSFIYSFDISETLESGSSISMILPSGGMTVFASQEQLVLAINGFRVSQPVSQRLRRGLQEVTVAEETYLLAYNLNGIATFNALGSVSGYVSSPYFFNHLKQNEGDYLYVATTTSAQWGIVGDEWTKTELAKAQLFVLDMSDMLVVSQVDDLGNPGESIFAVRYVGERAFIVTFEQTDPFISMDLSDPLNPTVAGELEIPGFSNYLHPVGDTFILGVGNEVDENGWSQAMQISLFDVSDLANPVRVQHFVETGEFSSSEAQYEFKAFRYLPESKLLILPLYIYSDTTTFDGFRVYDVDEINGISSYMSIAHAYGDFNNATFCYSSTGYLQPRSLVFDGDVMTLKGHTILSYDLSDKVPDAPGINLDEALDPEDCAPYGGGGDIMY